MPTELLCSLLSLPQHMAPVTLKGNGGKQRQKLSPQQFQEVTKYKDRIKGVGETGLPYVEKWKRASSCHQSANRH